VALKDDGRRLDIACYPLTIETRVLFSDMDSFRHVNNGATGRYLEEGRADLNMRVFGQECMIDPPEGMQLLFATVTVDYLLQAYYPGSVTVATGLKSVGRSSFVLAQAAFQNGECFALAEAVMVKAMDKRPAALTDVERAGLEAFLLAR
jgi:acyl-CoA thioester hydrolase